MVTKCKLEPAFEFSEQKSFDKMAKHSATSIVGAKVAKSKNLLAVCVIGRVAEILKNMRLIAYVKFKYKM